MKELIFSKKYLLFSFYLIVFFSCSSNKEETSFFSEDDKEQSVYTSVKPQVVETKDTFMLGEDISAKVFLNRTDYKTLAQQAGIKDYLKVYYSHGEHIAADSLNNLEEAEVEFDTGFVQFKPKELSSEFDFIAYPYDIVVKIDYDDAREGTDTTFIWRQEAIIKK